MEFTEKYLSKEVFRNTLFCLLAYWLLGLSFGLFFRIDYDYSTAKIILSTVISVLSTSLLFLMVFFFYRDFQKVHQEIKLKEIISIGLILYVFLCFTTVITLIINDDFKFSSSFIDNFINTILSLFVLFLIVFTLVINVIGIWKIYEKAGEKGWTAMVPFYNIIILLKIVEKPTWWIVLFLIPVVNVIIAILVAYALSKKFGKYDSFVFGLIFLPFIYYPILGFGDDEYGFD